MISEKGVLLSFAPGGHSPLVILVPTAQLVSDCRMTTVSAKPLESDDFIYMVSLKFKSKTTSKSGVDLSIYIQHGKTIREQPIITYEPYVKYG